MSESINEVFARYEYIGPDLTPYETAVYTLLVAEVERGNATPQDPDRRQMRMHSLDYEALDRAREKGACKALQSGMNSWPIVIDNRFESPKLVDPSRDENE